jgi:hypothetical protein
MDSGSAQSASYGGEFMFVQKRYFAQVAQMNVLPSSLIGDRAVVQKYWLGIGAHRPPHRYWLPCMSQ